MNTSIRNPLRNSVNIALALLITCGSLCWLVDSAHAFGAGGAGGHDGLTRAALAFLRSSPGSVLDEVVVGNTESDSLSPGQSNNHWHFDNSRFTESFNHINNQYSGVGGVVAALNPNQPNPFASAHAFGHLLHATQDFYSHTNWVDYNPANVPLFDTGTGAWPVPTPYSNVARGAQQLIVIEGLTPPAPIASFTIRAANGVSRLIDVNNNVLAKIGDGLVSGSWFLGAGPLSPPGATIPHGFFPSNADATTMNKDDNARTNYAAAFNAASAQTTHEWRRLLNLTRAAHGYAGASVGMALMIDPSQSILPIIAIGRPEVTVTVTKIKVLDDTDPFGAGEMNFTFTLYSDDFVESVRNEVTSLSIDSGNEVPAANLPGPLSLEVNAPQNVVITLQGWDDDNLLPASDGILDASDTVLTGVSLDFATMPFESKSYTLTTSHLEVTFSVTAVPEPTALSLALLIAPALWPAGRRAARRKEGLMRK